MTKEELRNTPINSILIIEHPDSVLNEHPALLLRRKHETRAIVKDLFGDAKLREFSAKFLRLATDKEKEIFNGKLPI